MSENTYSTDVSMILGGYDIGDIEGKILTIVESIGLHERQESAVKGLVRQAIWDTIHRPYRQYIYSREMDELYPILKKIEEGRLASSTPKKSK